MDTLKGLALIATLTRRRTTSIAGAAVDQRQRGNGFIKSLPELLSA